MHSMKQQRFLASTFGLHPRDLVAQVLSVNIACGCEPKIFVKNKVILPAVNFLEKLYI